MNDFIRLVGPQRAVELFGVRLVGVNAENLKKLVFTLIFIGIVMLLRNDAQRLANRVLRGTGDERPKFWTRQAIKLGSAILLILGPLSIRFEDPTRLATALGLVTAGLAFALQRAVPTVAGYFVILRGKTFNAGDRIVTVGVRAM